MRSPNRSCALASRRLLKATSVEKVDPFLLLSLFALCVCVGFQQSWKQLLPSHIAIPLLFSFSRRVFSFLSAMVSDVQGPLRGSSLRDAAHREPCWPNRAVCLSSTQWFGTNLPWPMCCWVSLPQFQLLRGRWLDLPREEYVLNAIIALCIYSMGTFFHRKIFKIKMRRPKWEGCW